jgi:hypothetical protein
MLDSRFQPLGDKVREVLADAGVDELSQARQNGVIEIDRADSRDSVEFLADCVISAAQGGSSHRNQTASQAIIARFLDKLSDYLSSGTDYLVLDEAIGRLVDAAVREGVVTPSAGPTKRSAEATGAAAFMSRLPSFPDASIDELLDIRQELSGPVTRFRSAMVTLAREFTAASWEPEFGGELHDAWVGTVAPAVLDIEEAVRARRTQAFQDY